MNTATLNRELESKVDNALKIANAVIKDRSLLPSLFDSLASTKASLKYKAIKILRFVSEKSPQTLYPHFERFEKLLESNNNILKWNAIDIIARMVSVDTENRFGKIFKKYYGLFNECSLITAAHLVTGSAKVIKSQPAVEPVITDKLLRVSDLALPTDECRAIAAGKVIEAFAEYYKNSNNQEAMLAFAKNQLNSQRPATKKKAEWFLKKFGK